MDLQPMMAAIGGPEALGIALAAALLYLGRQVLTRRPSTQAKTNASFGGRIQQVEEDLRLETVRRIQIEASLREQGVRLAPWPLDKGATFDQAIQDGPPPVDRGALADLAAEYAPHGDDTGELRRMPIPPLPSSPSITRHARRSETRP